MSKPTQKELEEFYYQNHKHIHVAGTTIGEHIDTCAVCDKDIRNGIHLSTKG